MGIARQLARILACVLKVCAKWRSNPRHTGHGHVPAQVCVVEGALLAVAEQEGDLLQAQAGVVEQLAYIALAQASQWLAMRAAGLCQASLQRAARKISLPSSLRLAARSRSLAIWSNASWAPAGASADAVACRCRGGAPKAANAAPG